jgi:hypothetical protein
MTSSSCLDSLIITKKYTRNNTVRILVQNLQAINTHEESGVGKLFKLFEDVSSWGGRNIQERDLGDKLLSASWEFDEEISVAAWELLKLYFSKNHIPFLENLN